MSIKIVSTDLPKTPRRKKAAPIVGEGSANNGSDQPSVPSPGVPVSDKTLSEAQVANLIAGHVKGLGGTVAAGVKWGVSDQMVRMVMGAHRRPSESMLADLGLEEIPAVRRYRKVRRQK